MKKIAGFTLIEVLVACTLLTVAIAGVAQLFAATTMANATARATTYATVLAVEKMEQLRALPFDDPALAISPADALRADADGYFDVPSAGYRRRWSIAALPGHPADSVTVSVAVMRDRSPVQATFVTIKTRKVR